MNDPVDGPASPSSAVPSGHLPSSAPLTGQDDVLDDVLRSSADWPTDDHAVGVTDRDATSASTGSADVVMPVASVTKPTFALGVLVAVNDGLVHLDEPAGPDSSTVRHLLAHASGLGPDADSPTTAAGRRRIYSNQGYEVLGDLITERTGAGPGEWLADEVFAPLGMDASTLAGSPAHAMTSTVTDLLALGRELLVPTLLEPELGDALATPQFPDLDGVLPGYGRQTPNPWGLGVEIRGTKEPHWTGPDQPATTFGHFGQSGSFLWVDRDLGVAVACLTDTTFGAWAVDAWAPFNQALFDQVREAVE